MIGVLSERHVAALLFGMVAAVVMSAQSGGSLAGAPSPTAAMRAADQAMYPDSFSMVVSISTLRAGGERSELQISIDHKAGLGSFMEMLSPPRSKGTRFLQTEGGLYMYSPRSGTRSPLRLSPRESFQGSVFSNNDVGDSTWENDYAAAVTGTASLESPDFGRVEVWVVTGTALRRDVPYGAIRLYLRKDDLLPLKIEYDAKSGLLLKTMEMSDFATIAGRLRPRRLVMKAADGTGETSTVLITGLRSRDDLPDAMFNQSWLVR